MSEWYQGKIYTTDHVCNMLDIKLPDTYTNPDGVVYVKTTNGYIREDLKDNKDVKRGLYMLSIPSNFISKINICEYGHVFSERNENGSANPEVKQWAEAVAAAIQNVHSQITRDYLLSIKN